MVSPILFERLASLAIGLLFVVLVSAIWIETDAYRVAAGLLVLSGIGIYVFEDFRPSIGWMGFACIGWALYVAVRYLVVYQSGTTRLLGAAEGIYLLPALYVTIGYMMYLYRRLLWPLVLLWLVTSLVMVVGTLDWLTFHDGKFHDFLFMNNTIHSSVAGGLIIIGAVNLAAFVSRNLRNRSQRWLMEGLAFAVVVATFIGLYGAKSKGVWVALAAASVVQLLMSVRFDISRPAFAKAVLLAGMLAIFVVSFALTNWSAIDASFDSSFGVVAKALVSGNPLDVMREEIASGSAPFSTNVRLMLWHNAMEVWSRNLMFGNGIAWLDLYESSHYKDLGFNIVHNGYLEIGMRYGLMGLGFFALLYAWTILKARQAVKRGLVAVEAYRFHAVSIVFFFCTIITNSNSRIAIGETFMMTAAAFGFYCFYLGQKQDHDARIGHRSV